MPRIVEMLEHSPPLTDKTHTEAERNATRHQIVANMARDAWELLRDSDIPGHVWFRYRGSGDSGLAEVRVGSIRIWGLLPSRWTEPMAANAREALMIRVAGVIEIEARFCP